MIDFTKMVTAETQKAKDNAQAMAEISAERDRRKEAGFTYGGKLFQARPGDIANINGAVTAATIAILSGAAKAGLRWSNPARDFEWISADNSTVPLDAHQMQAMGFAALAHVDGITHASRSIKDRVLAGENVDIYSDDEWAY